MSSRRSLRSLRKPTALSAGDLIHLVAPASPPIELDVIDKAVSRFTSLGFEVTVGKAAHERLGFIAGKDTQRVADLNRTLRSKKVRAVVCVRGGYGTGRIIGEIDHSALRNDPKIIVGCSDITVLHAIATKKSGIVSMHGPMPQSLVTDDCPEFTWKHLFAVLTASPDALGSIARGYEAPAGSIQSLYKGRVTAPLAGGNLAVLCSLLGTSYFPDLRGRIVCLEDIGETPFRVDRALTQLENAGALDDVAGFALGIFKNCEYRPFGPGDRPEFRQTLLDVVKERLARFRKPIVIGLPFGHVPHNATLPLGSLATLDAKRAELVLEEHGVRPVR